MNGSLRSLRIVLAVALLGGCLLVGCTSDDDGDRLGGVGGEGEGECSSEEGCLRYALLLGSSQRQQKRLPGSKPTKDTGEGEGEGEGPSGDPEGWCAGEAEACEEYIGTPCDEASDCGDDHRCVEGACYRNCPEPSESPWGSFGSCVDDADCVSGWYSCVGGRCVSDWCEGNGGCAELEGFEVGPSLGGLMGLEEPRLGVTVADLDGDGADDLLLGATDEALRVVLRVASGDARAELSTVEGHAPGLSEEGRWQALDLDGDGDVDLLHESGRAFTVLEGLGEGRFRLAADLWSLACPGVDPSGGGGSWPEWRAAPGDLDQDGDLDLLVVEGACHGDGPRDEALAPPFVLRNDGDLRFSHHEATGFELPLNSAFGLTLLVDLDGDGAQDFIGARYLWSYAEGQEHDARAVVQRGDGSGGFLPEAVVRLTGIESVHERSAALHDLDGDDRLDLLLQTGAPGCSVALALPGLADGTLGEPERVAITPREIRATQLLVWKPRVGQEPRLVTVGDEELSLFPALRAERPLRPQQILHYPSLRRVLPGDFDGDGWGDLLLVQRLRSH